MTPGQTQVSSQVRSRRKGGGGGSSAHLSPGSGWGMGERGEGGVDSPTPLRPQAPTRAPNEPSPSRICPASAARCAGLEKALRCSTVLSTKPAGWNPESRQSALGRKRRDQRPWEGGAQTPPGRKEPRPPVGEPRPPGREEPRPPGREKLRPPVGEPRPRGERSPDPRPPGGGAQTPREGRSPDPREGGAQTPGREERGAQTPDPRGERSPDPREGKLRPPVGELRPPVGEPRPPGREGKGAVRAALEGPAPDAAQRSPGRSGRGASWVRLSGGEDREATSPHPFPGGRAAPGAGPRSGARRARSARRLPNALGANAAERASRLL